MKIKGLSFDLWGTVIRSHPDYGQARLKYLTESRFNVQNLDSSEVNRIYKDVKKMYEHLAETTGCSFPPSELFGILLHRLGYVRYTDVDITEIHMNFNVLFCKYPPVPYSDETIPVLQELSGLGYKMSLGSNTGFMSGNLFEHASFRNQFQSKGIIFKFPTFSDRIGCSKPHDSFYAKIRKNFEMLDVKNSIQILHVGDNPVTDQLGPTRSKIPSMIINSNDKTISDVLTRLTR